MGEQRITYNWVEANTQGVRLRALKRVLGRLYALNDSSLSVIAALSIIKEFSFIDGAKNCFDIIDLMLNTHHPLLNIKESDFYDEEDIGVNTFNKNRYFLARFMPLLNLHLEIPYNEDGDCEKTTGYDFLLYSDDYRGWPYAQETEISQLMERLEILIGFVEGVIASCENANKIDLAALKSKIIKKRITA